ncbi:MAG: LysE family translocator [Desulfobacter sp.]|nr:LysE family translocator [Desulfobacter sp.]WDP86104.1 MAG: LysE family translocator [Desulfobacter sp.]
MSLEFFLGFTITVFLASIIPGPFMLLALTHGMRHGVMPTLASALGNLVVTMIQAMVSIVGLGTVLLASEFCFLVLKWAGAAYLVYMGLSIFFSARFSFTLPDSDRQGTTPVPLRNLFFQGAMVTAGNPKAIVFFTAVFPQFISPETGYLAQSSLLLGLMALIAFVCFMLYAVLGHKIVSFFSNAMIGRVLLQKIFPGQRDRSGVKFTQHKKTDFRRILSALKFLPS